MDVREIFAGCAFEATPIMEEGVLKRGLHVVFRDRVDFSLAGGNGALHRAFGRLVEHHGFVVFDGLYVAGGANSRASHGVSQAGYLNQDIFHTDAVRSGEDSTTLLYSFGLGRGVPTYYADAEDVRKATIKLLRQGNFPEYARSSLDWFADDDHDFTLSDGNMPFRGALLHGFPEFTERVFNQILPERRCAVEWPEDLERVVAHSNRVGGILHARPHGTDGENVLMTHVLGMPRL